MIQQIGLGLDAGKVTLGASTVSLRPYQRDAVTAVRDDYNGGCVQRTMIVLPTGGGKTIVAAQLAREMIEEQGVRRVLFLAHRDELIFQTVEKMKLVLGEDADIGVVKAERNESSAKIVVASIQTVQNQKRFDQLGAFELVIADEAHHATAESWMKVLEWAGVFAERGPWLFGMTATPDRTDGVGLGKVFETIAYEVGIFDLIDQGYLVDIKAKEVLIDADFSRIRVTRGDFNAGDSGRVLMQSQAPAVIARAYKEHGQGRQALVFVPTVEMAYATAEAMTTVGIPSKPLEANTPVEERRAMIAAMHAGTLKAICNVGVLTEGTDLPTVSAVVMAQPTKSRLRYTQMVGRGLRIFPEKENCLVLDLVGSVTKHRLQTVATLFGIEPKRLQTDTVRKAKIKQEVAQQQELTGQVIVRDIEAMPGRTMHWIKTAGGQYVLGAPPNLMVLKFGGGTAWGEPNWEIWRVGASQVPEKVRDGIPLDYAQGIAEDMARDTMGTGKKALVDPNARWRNDPVTEPQLKRCKWLGVPTEGIKTKGEASDAMNAAEAMKRLSGRIG